MSLHSLSVIVKQKGWLAQLPHSEVSFAVYTLLTFTMTVDSLIRVSRREVHNPNFTQLGIQLRLLSQGNPITQSKHWLTICTARLNNI